MADQQGVENEKNTIYVDKNDGKVALIAPESNGNSNDVGSTKTGKGRGHWRRGKKTKLGYRCTNYLKVKY